MPKLIIYIGTLKKSFTKNGKKFNVITGKTIISKVNLSAKVFSKIFTDVLKRAGFDVSTLHNGRLSISILSEGQPNNLDDHGWEATGYNLNEENLKDAINRNSVAQHGPAPGMTKLLAENDILVSLQIYPIGYEERDYFSTVSNVINLVGIHEFQEHGLNKKHNNHHHLILQEQRKDSSWAKTTAAFKEYYQWLEKNNNEYKPH